MQMIVIAWSIIWKRLKHTSGPRSPCRGNRFAWAPVNMFIATLASEPLLRYFTWFEWSLISIWLQYIMLKLSKNLIKQHRKYYKHSEASTSSSILLPTISHICISAHLNSFTFQVGSGLRLESFSVGTLPPWWTASGTIAAFLQNENQYTLTSQRHKGCMRICIKVPPKHDAWWSVTIFDDIWVHQHLWTSRICNQAAFCGAAGAAAGALFGFVPCGRGFSDFSAKSAPCVKCVEMQFSPKKRRQLQRGVKSLQELRCWLLAIWRCISLRIRQLELSLIYFLIGALLCPPGQTCLKRSRSWRPLGLYWCWPVLAPGQGGGHQFGPPVAIRPSLSRSLQRLWRFFSL